MRPEMKKHPPLPGKPEYRREDIIELGKEELLNRLARVSNPLAWKIAADLLVKSMQNGPSMRNRDQVHADLRRLCDGKEAPNLSVNFEILPRLAYTASLRYYLATLDRLRSVQLSEYIMLGPHEAKEMLMKRHPVLNLFPLAIRLRHSRDIAELLVDQFEVVSRPDFGWSNVIKSYAISVGGFLLLVIVNLMNSSSIMGALTISAIMQVIGAIIFKLLATKSGQALPLFLSFTDEVMDEPEWAAKQGSES